MLEFIVGFVGLHSTGARAEDLACDRKSCEAIFVDPLPKHVPPEIRDISSLNKNQKCLLFIAPYLANPANGNWHIYNHKSLPQLCKNIRIDEARTDFYSKHTTKDILYRQWEKWWLSTHGQFVKERANRPSRIFSDKFPAYMPCRLTETFTLESKYRNPEEFKDDDPERELDFETTIKDRVKNPPNPYFEIFPERARYFNCGWESDGLYRFSTFGTGRLPEPFPFDAAPFQQHFDAAHHRKHRAYALVDVRIVEHGPEILKILLSDANDAELRKRICTSFGDSCIAPRVIALVGNRRFDQAIGYCFHELAGGIVLPPMGCVLAALRLKKSKRYIMEALFSPDTKFYGEPGNGIGDTDISCTKRSPETMLAILKEKFREDQGWLISGRHDLRVMRLGKMSDVFRAFRENIVLNLTCHECDDGLRMVPTIYFNWQNIDKQETYRPIKVSEYNLYVRKLIARMGPEYDCIDGRRTDGLR